MMTAKMTVRLVGLTVFAATSGVFTACSAEADVDSPGACTISCSGHPVGASNYTITPIGSTAGGLTCADTNKPLERGVTVRFRVTETITLGGTGASSGGGSTGGLSLDVAPETMTVPRAGVSFEPVVTGDLSAEKTNDEHVSDATNHIITPSKFIGITTPSSQWCSDSCGVMTYEVWPICATNTVTAGILAGPINPPAPIAISVSDSTAKLR